MLHLCLLPNFQHLHNEPFKLETGTTTITFVYYDLNENVHGKYRVCISQQQYYIVGHIYNTTLHPIPSPADWLQ